MQPEQPVEQIEIPSTNAEILFTEFLPRLSKLKEFKPRDLGALRTVLKGLLQDMESLTCENYTLLQEIESLYHQQYEGEHWGALCRTPTISIMIHPTSTRADVIGELNAVIDALNSPPEKSDTPCKIYQFPHKGVKA